MLLSSIIFAVQFPTMNRRKFFRNGSIAAIGTALISPFSTVLGANTLDLPKGKKAKNIIFLVSDGMSTGTLNMTDLYLNRTFGKSSNWMQLYKDRKIVRALMDTASANSIVTDSSAASSSWGGGVRVQNGVLNVGPNGEKYLPILQKFKMSGKRVGCVTTVPITHATPAGFSVNSASRNSQEDIAETYAELLFDVMLGGGDKYFNSEKRKDKNDMYGVFQKKGVAVVKTKNNLAAANKIPLLGVFADDALPYTVDRNNDLTIQKEVPTLAEMSKKAIELLDNPKGFVMQIESGKVDWAAHGNDIAGLIHEQIAFDEAIKVAMDFAEKDGNTLVIITTDHGNANPGTIYGKKANENFDSIQKYTASNEVLLNSIHNDDTVNAVQKKVMDANGIKLDDKNAEKILSYYDGLNKEEGGLYNYRKLPFKVYSDMQSATNSVGWISMDHSGDYVELAMFGPGSELLPAFVKNTDLHYLMLQAAEVENKF